MKDFLQKPMSKRLFDAMNKAGLTTKDVARVVGKEMRTVQRWLNDKDDIEPKAGDIAAVEAEMLKMGSEMSPLTVVEARPTGGGYPLVTVKASAGGGFHAETVSQIDLNQEVSTWFNGFPSQLFWIEVVGDSMEPEHFAGEKILIQPLNGGGYMGDGAYIIRIEDMILLKRLQYLPKRIFSITSANENYKTFELPCEDVVLIGRVSGKVKRY